MSITGINIKGQHVVLREEAMADKYRDITWRVVRAVDGFGCSPTAGGSAVFVCDRSGETYRVDRGNVERLATAAEVDACWDAKLGLDSDGTFTEDDQGNWHRVEGS